jgi:Circularly permutated YpsA SLOG family
MQVGRERGLWAEVRDAAGLCVLTGGQTGIDTAAALAALRAGLPAHLIFPRGFLQEGGPITASRRRRLRGARLHELASSDFRYRTWTVVYLSDAVVLLDPAGGDGCQETVRSARSLGRPLLQLGPEPISDQELATWFDNVGVRVLAIAGCRASLLAGSGTIAGLSTQVATIAAAARLRHGRLLSLTSGMPG